VQPIGGLGAHLGNQSGQGAHPGQQDAMAAQVVHGGGEQRVRAIPGGERQRVQPDGERLDLS
jgi:hypothetical protein